MNDIFWHTFGNSEGEGKGKGDGEGDIDVIDTTCNKQDYLLYIAY